MRVKKAHKKDAMHTKTDDILKKNDTSSMIDKKNNTYYKHDVNGCPDLSKSIFLSPTAENFWIPHEVLSACFLINQKIEKINLICGLKIMEFLITKIYINLIFVIRLINLF